MADSITQPETNHTHEPGELITRPDEQPALPAQNTPEVAATGNSTPPTNVIWTPRFIVIFFLFLVIGLSADSLFTQGWENHYYPSAWILLGQLVLVFALLVAIIVVTRSWWVRLGGIFGCLWVIFLGINTLLSFYTLDPASPLPAYSNAAICSALLGCYICLSTARTLLTAWDTWFFRVVLIVGISAIALVYFITPAASRSLSALASDIAALALILCVLVWWLRPSCWKMQPCPTLLFGLTPAFTLLLSIPGMWNAATDLYFGLLSLLCFLLGTIRLLKCEIRN
jgi:hypothetical protein